VVDILIGPPSLFSGADEMQIAEQLSRSFEAHFAGMTVTIDGEIA
jgi:hypothetical protein